MKKLLCLTTILSLLILSSCASSAPVSPVVPDVSDPAMTENPTAMPDDPVSMAEAYAGPLIEAALSALEDSPRDDLSGTTFPFDDEYSYLGPTDEQTSLYGSSSDDVYVEDDIKYFNAICDLVVENIPQDASAYDKYRYLAYFLSEATDYDVKGLGGIMSITPYGAIAGGYSICLGYATAYLYLCEQADLWCSPVYGYSENGVHGWDLVKLEDGTYYVDVTWCDGLGRIGTDEWQSYFMLTEDVLLEDHGVLSGGPATGTTIFD
ncbi:MAG: hypothetical protein EOM54_11600 [Clostridia bacterium]|nr:hypothetical protein [Clostridia bacterium]